MKIMRFAFAACLLVFASSGHAQRIATDVAVETEAQEIFSGGFAISPQGPNTLAAYIDTQGGLRVVPLAGGNPTTLWDGGGVIESFIGSPDESWVIFVVRQGSATQGTRALYRALTNGSVLDELVAPIPFGNGAVNGDIQIDMAQSGSVAVFTVDTGSGFAPNASLRTVTRNASPVTIATVTSVGGAFIGFPQISPDGSRVAYAVQAFNLQAQSVEQTVFTAPIAGGATPLRTYTGGVLSFAMTPDGSRVVVASNEDVRSFPVAGGGGTLISGNVTPSPIMVQSMLSPNGQWALFVESDGASTTLYRTSVTSGGPQTVATGDVISPARMGFSDDSARLYFIDDDNDAQDITSRLFVRATQGGSPVEVTNGTTGFISLAYFTRGNNRIIHGTVPDANLLPMGVFATQVWSAPAAGGASVELTVPPAMGDVTQFGLPPFPTGTVELFVADGTLFRVPAAGGTPVDLSSASAGNEAVFYALPTADGQRVVFQSASNLRVITIDGAGGGSPGGGGGSGGGDGGSGGGTPPDMSSVIGPLITILLDDD